jgi:RNA recognition motif-containing protein
MNIFVGNLSTEATEKELENLFIEFGPVKTTKIIMDNYTKRPRGFAFVEMENRPDGEKAVEKLNNTSLHQKSMVINEARPQADRKDSFSNKRFNSRY